MYSRSTIRAKPQELPGDSVEDLGALEGGQEAQGADANAFTARTTHVAARLKVSMQALPVALANAMLLYSRSGKHVMDKLEVDFISGDPERID